MNFAPKHTDNILRGIYAFLVLASLIFMNFGTGIVRTVFMSLSVISLATGLYLFMRHEMTTFTYIVMENDGRLDFYVDKSSGKRGSYVCYYPLSDTLHFSKYEKGTKKEIYQKFGKTFVYNYRHNRFCGDKYIIVFQNNGYCDAVICELDEKHVSVLEKAISKSKESKAEE